MEKLDHDLQNRVWNRVYGNGQPLRLSPKQKQQLQQALNRSRANLAVYEALCSHSTYGDAFRRLAAETAEHIKMLRQMLQK